MVKQTYRFLKVILILKLTTNSKLISIQTHQLKKLVSIQWNTVILQNHQNQI